MKSKRIGYPYTFWMAVFVIVPLLMVLWYSFTDSSGVFTLSNFSKVTNPVIAGSYLESLKISLISTAICLVIAYPFSYLMTKLSFSAQKVVNMLVMLPMWMNFILRICAWVIILRPNGIIDGILSTLGFGNGSFQNGIYKTEAAVIIGIVYNFLPFMILPIYTTMAKIDKSLIEAGQDLGCSAFQVLNRVIFPLSIPGVITGVTMVFVPAASTIVISPRLGGFNMLGDTVEGYYKGQGADMHAGSMLSLVLMIVILISIAVMNRFDNGEDLAVV